MQKKGKTPSFLFAKFKVYIIMSQKHFLTLTTYAPLNSYGCIAQISLANKWKYSYSNPTKQNHPNPPIIGLLKVLQQKFTNQKISS